jgi:hypothetical protein
MQHYEKKACTDDLERKNASTGRTLYSRLAAFLVFFPETRVPLFPFSTLLIAAVGTKRSPLRRLSIIVRVRKAYHALEISGIYLPTRLCHIQGMY